MPERQQSVCEKIWTSNSSELQAMKKTKGIITFCVLGLLTVVVFLSAGCDKKREASAPAERIEATKLEPAEPNVAEIPKAESTQPGAAEPCEVEVPASRAKPNAFEAACELIYQGKFDAAGALIEQSGQDQQPQLSKLAEIIREYQGIDQRRQSAREDAYKEQLAELAKLEEAPFWAETEKSPAQAEVDANNPTDSNDVNDVSNITKALLVITNTCEFADQKQKDQLLSDPFVKQVFQKAIDKAAEFEAEDKWLEAYITCYSWLQAIDPNNEAYSDYAEQLIEKATIVASFQDSPCETSKERYEDVKEKMFVRAISFLHSNYVSVIDYRQMATKAIKRCKLLAEVMKSSFSQIQENGAMASWYEGSEGSFSPPDNKKLAAWSAALVALLDEVNTPTGIDKAKFIEVFEKVLKLNSTTLELPRPVLIAQFAEAALSTLDSYTVIVWPSQVKNFEKTMTNEFTGIGVEISKQKGLLTIVSLLPGTPAYNSGLDAGDVIEAVDGVSTSDMTLTCAVRKITGPADTEVRLTIRSPGDEQSRDITITRAKIVVPPIRGWQRTETGEWLYMIDQTHKIGYLRISSFSPRTAPDLEKVLEKLETEGLKGLILDLRFNSGGLLDSAIAVADKFIKEGLIVKTQPKGDGVPSWAPAHEKNTRPDYPLVVLINQYSASASEIVAGALADEAHNRAILVGQRTHGKGSVQGIDGYPGGGAQLKYTMAYYHLPSDQRVESQEVMEKLGRKDWGVGPNIEIKLRSDEIRKTSEVQRDNDVLAKADHDSEDTPLKKHTVEETLAADPQLAVAVLAVKTKLLEAENAGCK